LRQQLLTTGVMTAPDWCTLAITGPQDLANGHGQSWSGYWATLGPPGPDDAF
jgi:hypothetical protein